jgi:uncharacterized membrane protein
MFTDAHGEVRLVEPTTSSAYILELAFVEISQCGATSWHVTRRLAAAYDDLDAEGIDGWHEPIARLRGLLNRLVRKHATDPWDLEMARQSDRLGLG